MEVTLTGPVLQAKSSRAFFRTPDPTSFQNKILFRTAFHVDSFDMWLTPPSPLYFEEIPLFWPSPPLRDSNSFKLLCQMSLRVKDHPDPWSNFDISLNFEPGLWLWLGSVTDMRPTHVLFSQMFAHLLNIVKIESLYSIQNFQSKYCNRRHAANPCSA